MSARRGRCSESAGVGVVRRSSVREMTGSRMAASRATATSWTPMDGSVDLLFLARLPVHHAAKSAMVIATQARLNRASTVTDYNGGRGLGWHAICQEPRVPRFGQFDLAPALFRVQ